MQQFSIRDIENLCGIKAHTLRAWEQRYDLCKTGRQEGQHRVYNNDELKTWLRIACLYHQGHRISSIAALSAAELETLINAAGENEDAAGIFIHQLTEASLDFNKEQFEKIIHSVVLRNGLEYCIKYIFIPYLHRIGMLWLTNHAIPAQEHFASHIIRKKIILATDGLEPAVENTARILLFTPAGEHHEIPLLIANYLFRKAGLQTIYFGTNVQAGSLAFYLEKHAVTYLFTHVITYLNDHSPEEYLAAIRQHFRGKIIRSGPGFHFITPDPEKEVAIVSPDELTEIARRIAAGEII